MIRFVMMCGISGILILFVTTVLFVDGILILNLSKSRKAIAIFAVASLIPLLLGLAGTATIFAKVNRIIKETNYSPEPGSPEYETFQRNSAEAKYPIYLGAGSSASLLLIAVMGIAQKKRKAEPPLSPFR